jgi:hypothetical protein
MTNTDKARQLMEETEGDNQCVLCGKPMVSGWPLCSRCEAPTMEEGELLEGEFL